MDPHDTNSHHVPHVLDDPRDDPAFTAWLDAQEALGLSQRDGHRRRDPITPERRHS